MPNFKMRRKTIKILIITFAIIALTAFGYFKVTHFFEIDACLDKGGRWNYELEKCEASEISNAPSEWLFDKVDGSKLVFKDEQIFETNLFELAYIGQVSIDSKAPYLIFSGRDCNECDANISIYVHSPSD
jgi:hypothetical protein